MPQGLRTPRRALLSASDKAGLAELAAALHHAGCEIVSTGGTAAELRRAGLPVRDVAELTGVPEMLGGRVKTLHPAVHGGILGVEEDPEHASAMADRGIQPIDLVCIDLYPFERTAADPHASPRDAVEQIDIGGPAMIRSAAKNHARVAVLTSPDQYPRLVEELRAHGGTTAPHRAELAAAAFARTSAYDAAIARYLAGTPDEAEPWPPVLTPTLTRVRTLRYGENPHQRAALYRTGGGAGSVVGVRPLHGKELSYNNVLDAAAAWELATALWRTARTPAATVVKHANPCGAATAATPADAIANALSGDELAAFGGIVACSAAIDLDAAEQLCDERLFLEVIAAPAFEPDALERLRQRWRTTRMLALGGPAPTPAGEAAIRTVPGGALVQDPDTAAPDPDRWQHAAGPRASAEDLRAAAALVCVARALASNAVAVGGEAGGGGMALHGAGAGQMDRLAACRLALDKAGHHARGAIAASDGFFPFSDGPALLIDAGVRLIVQPGGSRRDQETIDLCQRRGVTLLLTGVRHFRH